VLDNTQESFLSSSLTVIISPLKVNEWGVRLEL